MEVSTDDLEAREGKIYVKGASAREISFKEAVNLALVERRTIEGKGEYRSEKGTQLERGTISFSAQNIYDKNYFGAAAAEVDVDRETGKVKVLRVASAYDLGFAIHPLGAEGQFANGVSLGMGQILYEDVILEKGQILNPSLLDYKVHTAMEAPEIIPILVENKDPSGPFGAKEAGVGVILSPAPAIANAIYNATGVMIKEFPITPEKILIALEKDVSVGNK